MTKEPTRRRVVVSAPTLSKCSLSVPPLEPGEALVEMSVSGCAARTRPAPTASTLFFHPLLPRT